MWFYLLLLGHCLLQLLVYIIELCVCVLLVLLVMVSVFFTGCFNLPPSLSSATMIHVLYGSASRNFQLLSSTEVIEVC